MRWRIILFRYGVLLLQKPPRSNRRSGLAVLAHWRNQLGRRSKQILPLGQVETYSYGTDGSLAAKTDFNGKTTTFSYDNMRRLISKTPDASLNQPSISFTYNDLGQRATMTDASGTTAYSYDTRNRLQSKQTPFGTLSYGYDAAGNTETLRSSNANGVSVDYSYDELNRLSAAKDNRLLGNQSTTYTFDAVGNLQSYAYPNQVTTSYAYNDLNRLTAMTVSNQLGGLQSYAYTLGATGNRTKVVEASGRTVDYVYDDLYRLSSETIANSQNNGQITYQFDAVGNRLQRTSNVTGVPSQSPTYDNNDRLNSDVYDNNGSTKVSNGKTYEYDFENRLTSVSNGITIVYDGDGNRVSKTAGGVTTNYLVDTNNLTGYAQVVEEIQSNTVVKTYTYGLDLISQRSASGVNFYQYDGHGSVRGLTDTSANLTDTYSYDAFGTITEQTGTTANNYLYAGEQFDPDLGFYYNRARYLNVGTGRFISQDPFEGSQSEPKTLHKYLYVSNNPVKSIDPSGYAEATLTGLNAGFIVNSIINTLAVIGVLAVTCAVVSSGSAFLDTPGIGPCGRNNENRVYRGTRHTAEIMAFEETGHLLSDEARQVYFETGSLIGAYARAVITHQKWNMLWGSELFHAQAHGAFGVEMERIFGMKRTFVSVTTDLATARYFAKGGKIYSAIVPRWQMVRQTLTGAGEGEWLIRFGRAGFSEYK